MIVFRLARCGRLQRGDAQACGDGQCPVAGPIRETPDDLLSIQGDAMRPMLRTTFLAMVLSFAIVSPAAMAGLPAEVENDGEFISWLTGLTEQVGQDQHYQRIPLDSEPQADEFTVALHRVFRGRMTDAEFTEWVAGRYPGHAYETATILKALHAHWKVSGN